MHVGVQTFQLSLPGSDRGRVDGILEKVDRFVEADGRFLVASVKREFR